MTGRGGNQLFLQTYHIEVDVVDPRLSRPSCSATVAACSAAAAAAAAVSTAAAASATAAFLARRTGFGLAHGQCTAIDILAIQRGDRCIRNVLVTNSNKRETAATAGFAIHDHLGAVDLAMGGKQCRE